MNEKTYKVFRYLIGLKTKNQTFSEMISMT